MTSHQVVTACFIAASVAALLLLAALLVSVAPPPLVYGWTAVTAVVAGFTAIRVMSTPPKHARRRS